MVLTSTHNLCFEQKYEKYQSFLPENFQFLEVKFSLYLNRLVFVMVVSLLRLRIRVNRGEKSPMPIARKVSYTIYRQYRNDPTYSDTLSSYHTCPKI